MSFDGIRIGYDPAGPDGDTGAVLIVVGDDTISVRSVLSTPTKPVSTNPTLADAAALHLAEVRRVRKVRRQAKGFR